MVGKFHRNKMNYYKNQYKKTCVGHSCRCQCPAAGTIILFVSNRPCSKVLKIENNCRADMNQGKNNQTRFCDVNKNPKCMKMLNISIKRIFSAINKQVSNEVGCQKEAESETGYCHKLLLGYRAAKSSYQPVHNLILSKFGIYT